MRHLHRSTAIFLIAAACAPQPAPIDGSSSSSDTSSDGGVSDTGAANPTTAVTTTATTSTTDPSTGATTVTSTADSSEFIARSDLDQTPQCDPFTQECPAGQKCTWWANDGGSAWNATKCVDIVDDPAGVDEPCTAEGMGVSGIDTCELGAMCWNVDTNGDGTCIAFCGGSELAPTCPPDSNCAIPSDGFALCIKNCDPFAQDCPGSDLCVPVNGEYLCIVAGENTPLHGDCDFADSCEKGLICASPGAAAECDPDATGCCEPLCDLEQPDCPGAGQMCFPVFDPPPTGFENVGFCSLVMP